MEGLIKQNTCIKCDNFLMLPIFLFDEKYFNLSNDAKILYAYILYFVRIAQKKGQVDKAKDVYITFSNELIMKKIGCRSEKAAKIKKELADAGLIIIKKSSYSNQNRYYLINLFHTSNIEGSNFDIQKKSVRISKEKYNIYNIKNKNNINLSEEGSDIDGVTVCNLSNYKDLKQYLQKHLYIDNLVNEYPDKKRRIEEIFQIILDTLYHPIPIQIDGNIIPKELVQQHFMEINKSHIEHALYCIEMTRNIRNIRKYLLSCLYNAAITFDNQLENKISSDLNY